MKQIAKIKQDMTLTVTQKAHIDRQREGEACTWQAIVPFDGFLKQKGQTFIKGSDRGLDCPASKPHLDDPGDPLLVTQHTPLSCF